MRSTLTTLSVNKSPDIPQWISCYLLLISLLAIIWTVPAHAEPRTIRVGVYANEPKIILDKHGQISGIFGDLLNEIANREKWTLVPVQCDWDECLLALQDGKIDLMPDIAYSKERAEKYDFHKVVVLHSWSAIYHREGTPVNSMLDLQGKRVAILKDSIQEKYLNEMLADFGVHAQMMPVHSLDDGFKKVASNEADVAVANRFFGEVKAPRYNLISSTIVYQPTQIFFGTRRGQNPDLLAAIDHHLSAWLKQQDSPYFKTMNKWTGQPALTVIPSWLVIGSAALAAMLAMALLMSAYLRHKVTEKTRHLQTGKDALAKSEQKLRTILDNVDAYIYLKDKQGRYLFANQHALDLLHANREDIVGSGDDKFFDAETAANIRRNDHRVLAGGETLKTEETNTVSGTGKTATYLSTKLPLRAEDGSIYALCGISIDITERKQTEQALRESKELLQLFIEHAPASLAMFDRDMRYVAVSQRWRTDYSLDDRPVIGHSHYEIFPNIPQRWKDIHRRGLAGEVIKADEDCFDRGDGSSPGSWLTERWVVSSFLL
jgi:PAS domain S-box-containing protein